MHIAVAQELSVVTQEQTLLWCSESWTLAEADKSLLTVTQNTMMRNIVATRRGTHEDWVSWIRRATNVARSWGEKVGVRKWCEAHAKAKWEWAGHVMRRGGETWVDKTTRWRDSEWGAAQPKGGNALRLGWRGTQKAGYRSNSSVIESMGIDAFDSGFV